MSVEKEIGVVGELTFFHPSSSQGLINERAFSSSFEVQRDLCYLANELNKQVVVSEVSTPKTNLHGDSIDELDNDPL